MNFSEELIKGNKSKEDIETLNIDEDIKEIFLEYFDKNYYKENELLVICEDVDYLNSIEPKAKEIASQCYVDGVFSRELYENSLIEQGLVNYIIEATCDDDLSESNKSDFDK
jgi:hypothetical protein